MCVYMCLYWPLSEAERKSGHSSTHPLFLQRSCNSLQAKHNQIHVGILNKNREGRPRGKNAIRITSGTSGGLPGVLQVFGSGSVAVILRGVKVLLRSEGQTVHRASHPSSAHGEPGPSPLSAPGPPRACASFPVPPALPACWRAWLCQNVHPVAVERPAVSTVAHPVSGTALSLIGGRGSLLCLLH